ncbi:unnamed protein product [Lepeophtheirus salmonis]|uniref:(salmon louse) hypothetical protein n=1 Tax=Lepeophtheirus salmonis TaxID=72036 RepID=A0A0K2TW32_LEPSM|nr:protein tramtrack, beta isoform-like isoform X2 [Lepeophtheirus salmonis]CAB4068624.1 unnamed protein product [Lepeophtheirus salmonis]CAF3012740.1 unnamed protein product [Lepeophtheirus salmonis]
MSVQAFKSQQYCLKWNNHNKNVSGFLERLRTLEQFVDVTLFTADQKSIKCHKILLSASSVYLEDILSNNPSDHPTIVLSQIYYNDLKLLIDFMYAGEVFVEQDCLVKLLDAAKVLKIKGLYEGSSTNDENNNDMNPGSPYDPSSDYTKRLYPPHDLNNIAMNMSKRKRKSWNANTNEHPMNSSSSECTKPIYGVPNAYYFTTPNTSSSSSGSSKSLSPLEAVSNMMPTNLSSNMSKIRNQAYTNNNCLSPLNNHILTSSVSKASEVVEPIYLPTGHTRRYKQYTEGSLQQALKDIMDGKSINRSSNKYNIPPRTLRDWMKRLNIKSAFTYNQSSKEFNECKFIKDGDIDQNSEGFGQRKEEFINDDRPVKNEVQLDAGVEEEIDDDEEEKLKIAE